MDVIIFLAMLIVIVWLLKILLDQFEPIPANIKLVILVICLICLLGWGFGYGGYHQFPWSHGVR
jgi:hypothetical protein